MLKPGKLPFTPQLSEPRCFTLSRVLVCALAAVVGALKPKMTAKLTARGKSTLFMVGLQNAREQISQRALYMAESNGREKSGITLD
jgi:hypothetical protein